MLRSMSWLRWYAYSRLTASKIRQRGRGRLPNQGIARGGGFRSQDHSACNQGVGNVTGLELGIGGHQLAARP